MEFNAFASLSIPYPGTRIPDSETTLRPLCEADVNRGDKWRDDDDGAQPWFGVPGQGEEAFVPEKEISEERDRQDVPGKGAAPGRERQDPWAIPGMEHGTQHERGPEHPEHRAFPVPPGKQ